MTQTQLQRREFEGGLSESTLGIIVSAGRRIRVGQREKLSCNAVSVTTSANPVGALKLPGP